MRELDDLPFAAHLHPLDDPLDDEGDHDRTLVEGDHRHLTVRNARFTQCAFRTARLTGTDFTATRFADSWLRNADLTGTSLTETSWQDVELVDSTLAGAELIGARLRRVTFEGCKLDGANLRGAQLREVTFRDCVLRDVDLGGAKLTGVTFPGSRVQFALRDTTLEKVDLREAASITVTEGVPALRGAIISRTQMFELAPLLAASIGLLVRD
ncbi:pentapeptide repeat-containing protein [Nocardia asteroides]|uniref:pentapeptide repeat-containing protein n=1 Tax=Nocardia asteroides TaxID=1824 RepID=UPI001E3E7624|nr:pentapeptide repeat-containing protein [Nocardia asteroides]UGT62240.1 pentapeptide repeat-containing protein [Nocardia asteroides]